MIRAFFVTVGVATLPLIEQRAAIPLGVLSFDLSLGQAVLAGIIGNILAVAIVLWVLPIVMRLAEKHWSWFHQFFQKIFMKTHAKHSHKFNTWGHVFLVFFVILPLPGSGGWTGALLAWLFGVSYWTALKLIALGIVLGAFVIAIMTLGIEESWRMFNEVVEVAGP